MRILWVIGNSGLYKNLSTKGTGSWIGAMQEALFKKYPDLKLGILLFHPTESETVTDGNTTYMPVPFNWGRNNLERIWIRHFRNEQKYIDSRVAAMCEKVRAFAPDIIHIWGLEGYYSQVAKLITDIPHVVHIQGMCSEYLKVYCPPGISFEEIANSEGFINRYILKKGSAYQLEIFERRAANEIEVGPYVKNWIGRTDWDMAVAKKLSPESSYFHCEEMMRADFNGEHWHYHYDGKTVHIMSTISDDWYKGIDVVLKTAKVLKQQGQDICWHIYGWQPNSFKLQFISNRLGIVPSEVGVVCHGSVSGAEIKDALLHSDCYVHPAYIENSSNAIAEAMLAGLPVIAQNVGGNASMLKDDSGILVPANAPEILAQQIISLTARPLAEAYSAKALSVARPRQDKDSIINTLFDIYSAIIRDDKV